MTAWKLPVLARTVALTVALLTAASCSSGDTPEGVAKGLIEGELASQLGLGEITATCEAPQNKDAGTTFKCTSPTDLGEISWLGTMTDNDTVSVDSINVLRADILPDLEAAIVAKLEENAQGATLGVENFDCGEKTVVLAADNSMICTLTDPVASSDVYDATVTITDMENLGFEVVVATEPRS